MTATSDKPDASAAPHNTAIVRSVTLTNNRFDSSELFASAREITIAHSGEIYRLRLTAQNKLILTK